MYLHREYRSESDDAVEKMTQPYVFVGAVLIVVEIHGRNAYGREAECFDKRCNRYGTTTRTFLYDWPVPNRIDRRHDLLRVGIAQRRSIRIHVSPTNHSDYAAVLGAD